MGFFDEVGKKVADVGQKTMQKTKEISDVARINSTISQAESKINNLYYQIGKLYVCMHAKDYEQEFEGMVNSIVGLERDVQEYKKQIQDVKGVQRCSQCGAEVPRGVAFCSSCGNAMPQFEAMTSSENSVKCMNCNAYVKKGMRFCTSCGKPLERLQITNDYEKKNATASMEKHCPSCGKILANDAVFCEKCGTKV